MPPQIKQAKLREEFHQLTRSLPQKIGGTATDIMFDFFLTELSQAKLETLEAIIKEVEGVRGKLYGSSRRATIKGLYNPNRDVVELYLIGETFGDLLTKLQSDLTLLKNER